MSAREDEPEEALDDAVDDSSRDSFPASDPPSFWGRDVSATQPIRRPGTRPARTS